MNFLYNYKTLDQHEATGEVKQSRETYGELLRNKEIEEQQNQRPKVGTFQRILLCISSAILTWRLYK